MRSIGKWPLAARIVLALVAATTGFAAANAQSTPQAISPLRVESDPNGVNLVDGRTQITGPVLSVPGAPNLRFDNVQNAAPYMSGSVLPGGPGQQRLENYAIHTGTGTSESFHCIDYDCTGSTGTGSTFRPNTNVFRQGGTGAVWHFNLMHVQTTGGPTQSRLFYASSVDYPNGESVSYTYETGYLAGDPLNRTFYRPIRLTSAYGYYITISYQASGDVGTPGWGSVAQTTLYASADPNTPLQQLTYNANGTVTDLAGRVFSCCGSTLGVNLEVVSGSLQLPGESSPTITVVAQPVQATAPVVASVTHDGVQWSYAYTNIRSWPQTGAWLYDGLTVTGPDGYHVVYGISQLNDAPGSPHNVISSITDSLGRTTSYQYDNAFRPILVTYPEGNSVIVVYDEFGNITSRTTHAKPGTGLPDLTETASYPTAECEPPAQSQVTCYRPTWVRDALGRQTDYVYNSGGLVTERTDPADADGVRRKTYITYTATGPMRPSVVRMCGATTTCGTANEIRTEYDYFGATSLPTAVRRIDSAHGVTLTTSYSYDNAGRVLSEDGPLAGTDDAKYYCYDILGRRTGEIGPLGANGLRSATRTTYRDSDDKVIRVETGTVTSTSCATLPTAMTLLNQVDTAYDAHRNPVREAASSGGTTYTLTQRTFDDRGQLSCEAQRMNPATFASPPASACTLGTQGSFGPDRITHNVYDNAGQLTQVQRAYATALQQNYATYSYTANGQRSSVTDANGNVATMTYDGHDRQIRWNFPSPTTPGVTSTTDYEQYGYDAVGNRTSLRKRDGSVLTYQYDNLNRMIVKVVPSRAGLTAAQTRDVYYGYDMQSLRLFARFDSAAGEGVTNTYDTLGRLLSSSIDMDGVTRTLSYQYDAASNRTRITHPDGQYFAYAYDAAGRLTTLGENAGAAILSASYNASGLPASLTRGGAATTFGYDPVNRLNALAHDLAGTTGDVNWTSAFNPASQIVTRTRSNDAYAWDGAVAVNRNYAVNGLNQYTTAGAATFAYDANGNLTGDGSNTYLYDVEDRLVGVSGARNAALIYDPLGRLFQVGGTQFLYDGDALVAEYGPSGTLLRRYVHGNNAVADDPLLWYEGASVSGTTRHQLFADHQGSIVAIADGSGTLTDHDSYDEWGIPGSANNASERFQYTGQAWLPEVGLYYYKARVYSPTLGRFMQTDPVGYQDQINLYAYVGNDPINHDDPSGNWTCGKDSSIQCGVISGALTMLRHLLPQLRGELAAQVRATLGAWGREGVNNGVVVQAGNFGGVTTSTHDGVTTVSVSRNINSISALQASVNAAAPAVVAHEGQHIHDERQILRGRDPSNRQEAYDLERRGSKLEGEISRAARYPGMGVVGGNEMRWDERWRGLPNERALMDTASRNYAWRVANQSGLPGHVDRPR